MAKSFVKFPQDPPVSPDSWPLPKNPTRFPARPDNAPPAARAGDRVLNKDAPIGTAGGAGSPSRSVTLREARSAMSGKDYRKLTTRAIRGGR